jgi:hypothetical protein
MVGVLKDAIQRRERSRRKLVGEVEYSIGEIWERMGRRRASESG